MVNEFNGFTKGVIGERLPADNTLNNKKKSELVKLLHIAQKNYDTLMQFYSHAIKHNKAMDDTMRELAEEVKQEIENGTIRIESGNERLFQLILSHAGQTEKKRR